MTNTVIFINVIIIINNRIKSLNSLRNFWLMMMIVTIIMSQFLLIFEWFYCIFIWLPVYLIIILLKIIKSKDKTKTKYRYSVCIYLAIQDFAEKFLGWPRYSLEMWPYQVFVFNMVSLVIHIFLSSVLQCLDPNGQNVINSWYDIII